MRNSVISPQPNSRLKKIFSLAAVIFAFVTTFQTAYCQNGVLISPGTGTADASAMLEVLSSNKGLLISRIGLSGPTDQSTISSPAISLMVYNTSSSGGLTTGYYYWDGSKWAKLSTLSGSGTANYVTKWTPDATTLGISKIYDNGTNVGIGAGTTPNNVLLDVNGSLALREGTALALASGENNNIALGAFSFFRITGPTAAFSINGLTGGVDGRIVTLYNTTTQVMTVSNEDLLSTDVNRIYTMTAADIVTPAGPNVVILQYNATNKRWIVVGGQKLSAPGSSGGIDWRHYIDNGF
jgi:hypothetical protein